MNKICYYDCLDGQRAITISAISMCPLQLYSMMREIMGLHRLGHCAHSGSIPPPVA
jgi:hypothetical protein